jgi:Co/Zn/Cd efflux system component
MSVAVAAIYVATVTLALVKNRRHHNLVVSGVALLAVAPILSYVAVAWIPAFAFSSL